MINLSKIPSPDHKLVFGEQTLGRLDLPYDAKFKQLAEIDEANVWFLNVVSCTNDRWYELPESALTKFQLTLGYQTVLDSLVPDVFKYLSEIITDPWLQYLYSRISTMEHTHCLTEGHEILTNKGYIDFKDITYEHQAANWHEDGSITFTPIDDIIKSPFKGSVYEFKSENGDGRTASITVTGNHRIPRIQNNRGINHGKLDVVLAEKASLVGYNLPVTGIYNQRVITPEEQLAIAYQADGCIQNKNFGDGSGSRQDGYTAIIFSFKRERKRDRLIEICKNGGIHFTERENKTKDGYYTISTRIPTKYISKDFSWVEDLSTMDFSEDFIQELTYWDGSRSNNLLRYTNTNSGAVEKVKSIAVLAGYSVGEYSTPSKTFDKTELSGRIYYQLTFTKKAVRSGRDYKKIEQYYEGNIYCVTVPSSFIIVRKKGSPYSIVTGNSLSYSSGVSQAFGAKATEFLDIIYTDPQIKHRIDDELAIATEFIQAVNSGWSNTEYNRKLLLTLLVGVFALEGVKFPFSFFTSWTLNKGYNNCAQGFSQLLLQIATDEMVVHTATGSNLINKLRKTEEFKEEFTSGWFDKMATDYFQRVADKETIWARYLLETGEEPGFNDTICEHFIQYWTDRRLKEINLPVIFDVKKNDIEVWFDEYRDVKNKQSALQEVSNINYQLGRCLNDLHKFDNKGSE